MYSGAEKDQGEKCCGSHLMASNELCTGSPRYNPVTKRMSQDDHICFEMNPWTGLPVNNEVHTYNTRSQVCQTLNQIYHQYHHY